MKPPILPRALLLLCLRGVAREAIVGDLDEGFATRAARDPREARRWYWRQTVGSIGSRWRPPPHFSWRLSDLWQDVRFGGRTLRRSPGFTAVAIATLAIGIGGTTAVFSLLHAVLLRPLPFADPDRLVAIGHPDATGRPSNLGYLTFRDWRDRTRAIEDAAAIRTWLATITDGPAGTAGSGEPERVPAVRVSWNFFRLLGVAPALGRDFRPEDDRPEAWRVVLLSDGLWRRRFGADPVIVGRSIGIHGRQYLVAGVMPSTLEELVSAHYYAPAEIWAPIGYDETTQDACRSCQHLNAIARLRPGVSIEAARAELATVQSALQRQFPVDYGSTPATMRGLRDELLGDIRPLLLVLFGAVSAVLLIVCANIASLLLARSASRDQELAVRCALGASRGRVIAQLLTESLLLSALGGVAGALVAEIGVAAIVTAAPADVPRLAAAGIDARMFAFSLGISLIAGLAFGLAPALGGSSRDPQLSLRAGQRHTADSTRWGRRALVAGEVAMAIVLLAGAGLMIRTMRNLLHVDPGFDSRNVLTLDLAFVGPAYAEDPAVLATQMRILDGVRALPGVEAAAFASQIPLGGNMDTWGFHAEGHPLSGSADAPSVERYGVSPEYFNVMRIPLKRGRRLASADRTDSARVVVISEAAAELVWPGQDPLNRRVRMPGIKGPWYTVVGVVGNVRHYELSAAPTPQMYVTESQVIDSFVTLTVRTTGDPRGVASAVRSIVIREAPGVAPAAAATLDELVSKSVRTQRFAMMLLGLFSGVALTLAMVGVYGTVAYSVARRTREFGVRLALGARRADIGRLVLAEAARVLAIGIIVGALAAIALTRLLGTLLYGVSPSDPWTLAAIVLVVAAATFVAQLTPALRATWVDPTTALQAE
ncbi:MAG TPA: ABC transporter permease [Vicinamibacterales bacterium]|jgi:putative ABC transport system permease protein|nr:ABC transporter permease [Vicinamibacterales bacterium]